MISLSSILFILLLLLALKILFWCRKRLNYFKDRNVPYLKSFPFIGALKNVIIGKQGLYECSEEIYNNKQFENEPFFGIFMFHKPALLIKDPDLIKRILIKDFNSFVNHHGGSHENDPMGTSNIFAAKDNLWKNLRKKLSPFFTSGKMKAMFPILDKLSDDLMNHIKNDLFVQNENSAVIKMKHIVSLFTTDVITSCAFGVDANSIQNPKGEFHQLSEKLFNFTFYRGIEFTSMFLLPEITKYLNCKWFTKEGSEFIIKTILSVMSEREKSGIKRHDLIDTLIEIKNSDMVNDDGKHLTVEMLIAQAAIFFSAGHETSSSSITFILYELAKSQDVQKKVRAEIQNVLQKDNGVVNYEAVMHETPYLDQVLTETLRLYSVLPLMDRECTNPEGYSLKPYSDFVIPYKMPVYIPVYAIQRDEKYFADPLKFNPDRFSPENIHEIHPCTNMPFGTGNRICIGERFGLMQTKIGLFKILKKYHVEMAEDTPTKLKLAKNAFVIQPEVPITLKLVKDEMKF